MRRVYASGAAGRSLRPSLDWLLVLVPISFALGLSGGAYLAVFLTAVAAILLLAGLSADGRSNWLEGAQLTGAYVIMAISFFFVEHR